MAYNDLILAAARHGHAEPAPHEPSRPARMAVQRWGFSEAETLGVLADWPALDGALEWQLAERARTRSDAMVHLVDAARLAGAAGAAWSAMGPVDAMRRARTAGRLELALVLGQASHLPMVRAGCWVLAGARSLADAMMILVRATLGEAAPAGAARQRLHLLRELAALDASCILLQREAEDAAQLADRIRTDAGALLDGYAKPAWLCAAGPDSALDVLRNHPGLSPRRLRLTPAPPATCCVDLVVAFPWPDLMR